jgi:ATP-dependent RNA helicase DOB1
VQEGVLLQKGRVAAEIESVDELVSTELIFDGLLSELDPAQVVALLSCLFPEERASSSSHDRTPSTDPLHKALGKLQQAARTAAAVAQECRPRRPPRSASVLSVLVPELSSGACGAVWCAGKLDINTDQYVQSFAPSLMWGESSVSSVRGARFLAEALRVRVLVFLTVTYQWCKGKSFPEICALTDQFEGSIIRTTRRLEGARLGMSRVVQCSAGAVADASLNAQSCCVSFTRPPPLSATQSSKTSSKKERASSNTELSSLAVSTCELHL